MASFLFSQSQFKFETMDQDLISVARDNLEKWQTQSHARIAALLAFTAGYMDAVGITKWKTYVSFMSGNTIQLGIVVHHNKADAMLVSSVAIGCFMAGIFIGTYLSAKLKFSNQALLFLIVSGILMVYMVISLFFTVGPIVSIATVGLSMGMMNTIVTTVGKEQVNTDFITGTLNHVARYVALWSMSKDMKQRKLYKTNILNLLLIYMGFIIGAYMAASMMPTLGKWTLFLPILLLISSAWLYNFYLLNAKNLTYVTEK